MFFKRTILCTALSLAAFSLPATAATFGTQVTKDYKSGGLEWGGNGNMVYVWSTTVVDGKLAMCGAYSSAGSSKFARFNKAALAKAKLQVDGKTVMNSMSFFKSLKNEDRAHGHIGDAATCKTTRADAPAAGAKIELVFKSGSYRIDR
jgi:hypothetical protein